MTPVFCSSFEFAVVFHIILFFNVVNPGPFKPALCSDGIDFAFQYQQSVVATTSFKNVPCITIFTHWPFGRTVVFHYNLAKHFLAFSLQLILNIRR